VALLKSVILPLNIKVKDEETFAVKRVRLIRVVPIVSMCGCIYGGTVFYLNAD